MLRLKDCGEEFQKAAGLFYGYQYRGFALGKPGVQVICIIPLIQEMAPEEGYDVEVLQTHGLIDRESLLAACGCVGLNKILGTDNWPALLKNTQVDQQVADVADVRKVRVIGAHNVDFIYAGSVHHLLESYAVVLNKNADVVRSAQKQHRYANATKLPGGEPRVRPRTSITLKLSLNHRRNRRDSRHSLVRAGTSPARSHSYCSHPAKRMSDNANLSPVEPIVKRITRELAALEHGIYKK